MMTCEQFQSIVQDLELRGALDEATCALAQMHAQGCPLCAALRAQFRALKAGLKSLEAGEAGDSAPPRVEAILRSAFLRRKWEAARAKSMRRWAAVGIAAALLLTAGVASRMLRRPKAPTGYSQAETIAGIKPAPQPASGAGPATPGTSRIAEGKTFRNSSGGGPSDDDLAADFVPYPAGGAILPYENAQIVRVNLPGSALVAMGYPLDGDRAGERFTADLLVGEDGLPRAIRFPQ